DDALFSTIKVVSRHQTTQQYGAILPIELITDEIKNSKAYKEYYACATGEAALRLKASAKKKKGDFASSTTPPTPTPTTTVESTPRLSATAKDVGGHEEGNKSDESDDERDEGSDDDSDETVEAGAGKDDDDNDDEDNDDNDEEEELAKNTDELYRNVNINQGRGLQVTQNVEDSHVTLTPV
nr:hypothetical protein [Tanacetum cinerariifolium]